MTKARSGSLAEPVAPGGGSTPAGIVDACAPRSASGEARDHALHQVCFVASAPRGPDFGFSWSPRQSSSRSWTRTQLVGPRLQRRDSGRPARRLGSGRVVEVGGSELVVLLGS